MRLPPSVPVALDDVVLVLGHVLGMAREDDEVVRLGQLVAARVRLEVVVGQEVDVLPGPVQPRDKIEIPVAEPVRDAEVEERPREVDRPGRAADVPAVAPAVAVRVPEVVRLPRVRREDDGDARRSGRAS